MVRATLQRGTIHLLDAGAYPVWRAALADELAALPRGLGPAARAVDVPAVRAAAWSSSGVVRCASASCDRRWPSAFPKRTRTSSGSSPG